jgi:hypothetical protein
MAEITEIRPGVDGAELELAAAAASDTFAIRPHRALVVTNGSGAPITATFVVPGSTATGEAIPDNEITIPAGETWVIPTIEVYRSPTTRMGAVNWSSTTSVTRRILQL